MPYEGIYLMCVCGGRNRSDPADNLNQKQISVDEVKTKKLINMKKRNLEWMSDTQFEELKPSLISDFDEPEE